MRAVMLLAALALAGAAWAQAPTPNPMMQHYRAYAVAMERGEYGRAETEAVAALAAAQATNNPRVGVLATNLARVRALMLADLASAAAPAAGALAAGGVNVHEARVLVALTQLAEKPDASGDLEAALAAAAADSQTDRRFLNQAAAAWGDWSLANEKFPFAVTAFAIALEQAHSLGADAQIEEASARIGRGKAYAFSDDQVGAAKDFYAAVNLLRPHMRESIGPKVSPLEATYHMALAWQMTMLTVLGPGRIRRHDLSLVEYASPYEPTELSKLCLGRMALGTPIQYPSNESSRLSVGTIIVRSRVDENGRVHDPVVVAAAPALPAFIEATLESIRTARVTWEGENCRRSTDDYITRFPFIIPRI